MGKRLKRWELALMFGLLFAMTVGGWLNREQTTLAESVIRFHVIANSDSPSDQALKLAVRDRVLACAQELYPEGGTLEDARTVLSQNLDRLAQTGQSVIEENGCSYPVTAQLEHCWFPTKEYDDFSLPAGNYEALRIVIGEGEGRNWWCVAFPPLCLGAASETVDTAVDAGYFTPAQAALVRRENGCYILKFKSLELLGKLQARLSD